MRTSTTALVTLASIALVVALFGIPNIGRLSPSTASTNASSNLGGVDITGLTTRAGALSDQSYPSH
jgi:hypothetical protein